MSRPGQMFDPAGPRTRARIPRDCCLTPRAFGPGPQLPRTVGGPHGTLDQSARVPGPLVDTAGTQSWAGVARDIWLTPQVVGQGPEPTGRHGRSRGPLGPKLEWLGQLVEHAGPQSRAGLARDIWLTLLGLGHGPNLPKKLVDPAVSRNPARVVKDFRSTSQALGPERESPGTDCQP